MNSPLLSVRDLCVTFPSEAGLVHSVNGVNFDLYPGKTLGIVGESGSGKSVTSMAIMGLLPEYARVEGSVKLEGTELLELDDKEMSAYRGKDMGMIFQDPLSALTPVFSVGTQIMEALTIHQNMSKKEARAHAIELLDMVGIPNPHTRVDSFPHEFSGGMRQRVVIAQAIANNPKIIIADEPTTALDVTIQAQILDVLKKAQKELGAAVIMITHDMGVVAGTADDVLVMYAGRPVEHAPVNEIFSAPRMPYTIGLLGSIPNVQVKEKLALTAIEGNPPVVIGMKNECSFAPRCPVAQAQCHEKVPSLREVSMQEGASDQKHLAACVLSDRIQNSRIDGKELFPRPVLSESIFADIPRKDREQSLEVKNLTKVYPLLKGALMKRKIGNVYAVNDISFDIRQGECLAIVGESGCGKTSTLMEIMQLAAHSTDGKILLGGVDVSTLNRKERQEIRKDIQMVFQDPMGALNPRMTVREIISEPLRVFDYPREKINHRVHELMDLVGLDPTHSDRFPAHFSGGQRQRIGLARALATKPKVIVLDEPVSALDVSIQASMINLLDELKRTLGLSYLFIAHDLSVVRHISDRVAVMYLGSFVEIGDTDEVFDNPQHPYTKALLSAIPIPDPVVEKTREKITLQGDLPSPTERNKGCSFRTRCTLFPHLQDSDKQICIATKPQMRVAQEGGESNDHEYSCHFIKR